MPGFAPETRHGQIGNRARAGRKPGTGVPPNIKNRKNNAADARSAPQASEEADYFRRGKEILGSKAGGMLADLLRSKGRNIALARAAIEYASQKEKPREYIGRILAGPRVEAGVISARATGIV